MNNNRELVLEAEDVIKKLAAEVQTMASASAAEQRATANYQSSVELVAQATSHFQATAHTIDEKMHEVLNELEFVKTLNEKAERRLMKGVKQTIGISVCALVFSLSTLVYVLWHLHG